MWWVPRSDFSVDCRLGNLDGCHPGAGGADVNAGSPSRQVRKHRGV